MKRRRVLFVDDDDTFRAVLQKEIQAFGYEVFSLPGALGAEDIVRKFAPDVALLDLRMPGMGGIELMELLHKIDEDLLVIMLTGHGSVPEAVQAIRLGAYDFLTKPAPLDQIEQVLERACQRRQLGTQVRGLQRLAEERQGSYVSGTDEILGASPVIDDLRGQITKVAQGDATVLIQGENGTGKELVARAIHSESPRAGKAFVVIHCGAIPESLVASELFGHERGAFTGALRRRAGLFEAAEGGTLFLDEIGELPLSIQPTLLRAIQFGEIRSVGSQRSRRLDVRVISATHRNLEKDVAQGRFREDLFYRISTILLRVPPLRERREDIPLLARSFFEREHVRGGPLKQLSPEAEKTLCGLDWPGNVRELENAILRLRTFVNANTIEAEDIHAFVAQSKKPSSGSLPTLCLDALERLAVLEAMERHGGDKKEASLELGVSLKTLYNKLAKYR